MHCSYLQILQEEGIRFHYGWLWATMWLLGFELRTFRRAVGCLNNWAISPTPSVVFSNIPLICANISVPGTLPVDSFISNRYGAWLGNWGCATSSVPQPWLQWENQLERPKSPPPNMPMGCLGKSQSSTNVTQTVTQKNRRNRWGTVAHAFNPSTWEAEVSGFLILRPAWSAKWAPGQPGLYRETLSWKTKQNKTKQNKTKQPILGSRFSGFYIYICVLC